MKEVILCKYGELILKGANRGTFETVLQKELRRRARHAGEFRITTRQSTVMIEPLSDDPLVSDVDEMYRQAKLVFGFAAVTRAAACEKSMDAILATAAAYLPDRLRGYRTFRAEAKRSDKRFPLTSPEIAGEVGAVVLENVRGIKVNLVDPDITVRVEIRDTEAFIHAGQEKGAGGIPSGSSGNGLLLLSGGIDSPVAGYMMAKRGLNVEALHFESFPYTSELAREKVFRLAKELCEYTGRMRIHVVSLTHIQEVLRDSCTEDYFTLLLRRFMMAIADRIAKEDACGCLITGESLGQVASQTLAAIGVTDPMTTLPVFRPCIGMDKEEIISISRKIGTFDTSIEPYEDCCTVFTPKHPKTKPEIEKVLAEEAKIDWNGLLEEAMQTRYAVVARQYGDVIYENENKDGKGSC